MPVTPSARRSQDSAVQSCGDDGLLGGFHGGALVRIRVLVAGEMEQAVDEVAQNFAGERLVVFGGLALGDFGADDDLAVVEGDDVGGPFDVHEIAVDLVAGGIIDERDFEGGEVEQRRVIARRRFPRRAARLRGRRFQAR